jgi:hypothetical protein
MKTRITRNGTIGTSVGIAAAVALAFGSPPQPENGPPSGAARWSPHVELSTAGTRSARGLKIDANTVGDFVAAWVINGADDIAAVIRNAGSAAGAPQVFEGDYDDPDVAIGGGSVGVLAWESKSTLDYVYVASKAGTATLFSSPQSFTGDGHTGPTAPPSAQDPVVAVNGFGTGMLFFERDYYNPPSYSTLAEAVEGRILLDAATNTWSAGVDLHSNPREPRSTEVSVAADGSVFYGSNGFELGPCYYLHGMVLENDGSGGPGSGGYFAYTCGGALNGIYPSNARLPNGDVVMAFHYHTGAGIYVLDITKARAMSSTADNLWLGAVRVDNADNTEDGLWPRVRTDAVGNAVVVWYDTSGTQSMLARFRPAGTAIWGPVEVISSGESYQPDFDFDMDAAGNGYLVYERSVGGSEQIVGVERRPGAAGIWTVPEVLSGGLSPVKEPQVAAGSNGQAFAAWIAGAANEVHMSVISPQTAVNPPSNAAAIKRLQKSIKKLQKSIKKARKSGNRKKAAVLTKKLRKLQIRLKALRRA